MATCAQLLLQKVVLMLINILVIIIFDDGLIRINCDEFGNIKLDIKNSHYYIQGKITS